MCMIIDPLNSVVPNFNFPFVYWLRLTMYIPWCKIDNRQVLLFTHDIQHCHCQTVHSALFPTCHRYLVCLKSFVRLPITYPCGPKLTWTKTLMQGVTMCKSHAEWYCKS